MKRVSRAAAAGAFALGVASWAGVALAPQGCGDDEQAPKPSASEPILIGVSFGLTKEHAAFAAPLRDTVKSAEGQINAGGGLLGRQVRFEIVDDQSDEGDGVMKIARDFVKKRVTAVIGPIGSGQVKATQQILHDNGIVQITPTATSVELNTVQSSGDRFLFRTTSADDFQGTAVLLFASKTPRGLVDGGAAAPVDAGADGGIPSTCHRLALLHVDNAYGESMSGVIRDGFRKNPANEIVWEETLPVDPEPTYALRARSIIDSDPQCLALLTYEQVGAQFIHDFKADKDYAALERRGFFFIGTDGIFTPAFLEKSRSDPANEASPSTAEGVFGTSPDTQPGTPEYKAFRTIYASYFPLGSTGEAPAFAANTFDAAVLVAFAIEKANSLDGQAVRDALGEVSRPPGRPVGPSEIGEGLAELRRGGDIDYKGASGNVDLDDVGNVTSGFIVWEAVRDQASKKVVYRTVARFDSQTLLELMK